MEQNQQMSGGKTILRRSEEEIQKFLNEQEQSGLTVKEYCDMYDLVEQTFYGWTKRYRSKVSVDVKDLAAGSGGFASIEVVPALIHDRPQLFAEVGNIRLLYLTVELYTRISVEKYTT